MVAQETKLVEEVAVVLWDLVADCVRDDHQKRADVLDGDAEEVVDALLLPGTARRHYLCQCRLRDLSRGPRKRVALEPADLKAELLALLVQQPEALQVGARPVEGPGAGKRRSIRSLSA